MHGVPLHEGPIPEKDVHAVLDSSHSSKDIENGVGVAEAVEEGQVLKRDLQGRHMQMIAIGGSIGAGLFVGSGGSLTTGGPGFLVSSGETCTLRWCKSNNSIVDRILVGRSPLAIHYAGSW